MILLIVPIMQGIYIDGFRISRELQRLRVSMRDFPNFSDRLMTSFVAVHVSRENLGWHAKTGD